MPGGWGPFHAVCQLVDEASRPAPAVHACPAVLQAVRREELFLMEKKSGTSVEGALRTGEPHCWETEAPPFPQRVCTASRPAPEARTMMESRPGFLC